MNASRIEVQRPTGEEIARAASLCERLKKIGLNPDPWLSHKGRQGVQIAMVIRVLEQALEQKVPIRNFWAWAETALAGISEREAISARVREHEKSKLEFAQGVDEILEQVALRAIRKRDAGEVME